MQVVKLVMAIFLNVLVNWGPMIVYMMNVPRILHFAQLEGYGIRDYTRWICKNPKLAFKVEFPQFIGTLVTFLTVFLVNMFLAKNLSSASLRIVMIVECFSLLAVYMIPNIAKAMRERKKRKQAKKPLVYTGRAKRLMFWSFLAAGLLENSLIGQYAGTFYELIIAPLVYAFLTFAGPVNMILALFLALPTENWIKNGYIRKAKWKLWKKEYKNLIKIGITGSFGKTSTKFILQTILSEKYKVLATPESYNTTFGNTKVIREMLTKEHEVFISEMGARYRFEIAEICDFVKPQIGMITSIDKQHLETFKNIDTIVKAKSELLSALPDDGVVVLPNDQSYCLKLYQKEKRKKYLYAIQDKKADVYAKDMKVTNEGISFIAVTSLGEIHCNAKLLGEHNVQNILGSIAIAIHLGLSKEQIEAGVSKIEPIPHRLQLIQNPNGIQVIDDAFNSNPEGSKAALKVLKSFAGRKIVITPGMVELGTEEEKYNKEFGRQMADAVDIAILVGNKRSMPIVEGLKEKHFDEMNIFVVDSLKSATQKLNEMARAGDVVLFENDLPDNYDESL